MGVDLKIAATPLTVEEEELKLGQPNVDLGHKSKLG